MASLDQEKLRLEMCRRDPMFFRESILVDAGNKLVPLGKVMSQVQRDDFKARDECMLWAAKIPKHMPRGKAVDRERPAIRKFYSQRSRGYSKTSDIALDLIWMLIFATYKMDGLIVAEDLEQAQLVLTQASKILDVNPWLLAYVEVQKKALISKTNGSVFKCLSSDIGSSYGLTPDLVVADEWSAWSSSTWWDSIFSSFAKKDKMLIVGCNALATGSWQIEKREAFKKEPDWYCSIPVGYAPWYNEDTIQSQRVGIDYAEFQRLWMNIDSDVGNIFIDKEYVEACRDSVLERQEVGSEHIPTYIVAVDYAERIDRTVISVSHLYGGTVIVDRMDVIDPQQRGGTILVGEVIEHLDQIDRDFGTNSELVFVFDRHQMAHCCQILKAAGRTVEEFEFRSGIGNHQASVLLQQYLLENKVRWYSGCGEMYDADGNLWMPRGVRDDLETELLSLVITASAQTKRWRFDHPRGGHDDRSFALAATIHYIHKRLMEDAEDDIYESEAV